MSGAAPRGVHGVAARPGARSPDVAHAVEQVLRKVGKRVVLALPLGIGKPSQLANEFVRRAVGDTRLDLTILTALTLRRPTWKGELERRLIEPIDQRLFADHPRLEYDELLHAGKLPANVRVSEFYFAPGSRLGDARSQQEHAAANYSAVVRDALARGLNVLAHMVAVEGEGAATRYSLSSNTDITLDLLPLLGAREAAGTPTAVVAQVNRRLPFMTGEAVVGAAAFDAIVDDPALDFEPFATPSEPIGLAEAAIGLHASALVRDGGTLQLGIGALGDALTQALLVRQRDPEGYAQMLAATGILARHGALIEREGGTRPFVQGLYASTEMLAGGLLELQRAGVLSRRVYAHPYLQQLADRGELDEELTLDLIERMAAAGVVSRRFSRRDVCDLVQAGILREGVTWRAGRLCFAEPAVPDVAADLDDPATRQALVGHGLQQRLTGTLIHAGFFLGPRRTYAALRELTPELRERIRMTSISFTNDLYGQEQTKRAQRRHARFVNTGLMATLLGDVVSDALEDGRVVSGVGGQHDFVCMAHALQGARSVVLLRSTREHEGRVRSSVVASYANVTIPGHLRDLVVTEYGIADLRGRSDAEVIEAMLAVTDARFQPELARGALAAGKLPRGFRIPERWRDNTPERLQRTYAPERSAGRLPRLPFGSDLGDEELTLAADLRALRGAWKGKQGWLPGWRELGACLVPPRSAAPFLRRMGLEHPSGLRERALKLVLLHALARRGSIPRHAPAP